MYITCTSVFAGETQVFFRLVFFFFFLQREREDVAGDILADLAVKTG